MSNSNSPIDSKLTCEDSATGTFRYNNSTNYYCVNRYDFTEFLEKYAQTHNLSQSRICYHSEDSSILQLMLVFHSTLHKVKKHVHLEKDEYLHILKGNLEVRIYNKDNLIISIISLSDDTSDKNSNLFCFLPRGIIPDVVINRDACFLETTTGPFDKLSTLNL